MIKLINSVCAVLLATIIITGCGGSAENGSGKSSGENDQTQEIPLESEVPGALIGKYQGIQPAYNIKDDYGDDIVFNGQKMSIPSLEHKFILDVKNQVQLKQISLEDQNAAYYEGKMIILEETNESIKIQCNLEGPDSAPIIFLNFNKVDQTAVVSNSGGGPDFIVSKQE
jgi:hypothetical protein